MINFYSETDFNIKNKSLYVSWIKRIISSEGKILGSINYIFCDDDYLHQINVQFLDHDTLTDIISFDYTQKNVVSGDIYISVERVLENAKEYQVSFEKELLRVLAHGVLHFCGYKDKTQEEENLMRKKEEEKILLFNENENL